MTETTHPVYAGVTFEKPLVLVGVTGLARSGKDTLADYLVRMHGFTKLAFADALKDAAAVLLDQPIERMYGGDRESTLSGWPFSIREFLQRFGTEAMRHTFGDDFWVKTLTRRMTQRMAAGDRQFVITDCRFENEATWVRHMGGRIVHVFRPGVERMNHASEHGIGVYFKDLTISNDMGLLDYYATIAEAVIELDKSGHLYGNPPAAGAIGGR